MSGGANINSRDSFGQTPLMLADEEAATLLLQHGADVRAKDMMKCTPLYGALNQALPTLIDLLISRGADVNAVDGYGYNFLYRAKELEEAFPGNAEIVQLLKRHGAKLNKRAKERLERDHIKVGIGIQDGVHDFVSTWILGGFV